MRRLLPLPAAAALFLLIACGGSGDPSTPTPTVDFATAARQAVAGALVTLEDLPQFWTEGASSDGNFELDLSPQCDVFDPNVAFPGAVATDQSPVYLGSGERQASFVTAVFREEDTAEAAIDGQDALVDRCLDEFLDAIEQAARDEAARQAGELGSLANVDVGLESIDFASLGDQTSARRASVTVSVIGIRADFAADVIVVRSRRVAGVLTYSNFESIDTEEEELIATAMATKLAAADASLPE